MHWFPKRSVYHSPISMMITPLRQPYSHDYKLIKTEMWCKLGRIVQSQGSSAKASITFHIAKETWNMLLSSIILGLKRIVSFHRPKRILDQGLKVQSVSDGVDDADFILFETKQ